MKNTRFKVICVLIIITITSLLLINNWKSTTEEIYINEDYIKENKKQIGIYVEQENGSYTYSNTIPNKDDGYVLNTSDSVCDGNTSISWDNDNWNAIIKNINQENLKCYLYFRRLTQAEKTLVELDLHPQGDVGAITGPSCSGDKGSECYSGGGKLNMAQSGIYEAEDDFGASYVFRGTVNNNWVKFGQEGSDDLWWRIIRINGNGTIRLIYAGKGSSPSTTGPSTQIATTYSDKINQKYNVDYGDNTYVGFMYGTPGQNNYGDTHKNNTKSTIMDELEKWYAKTTLSSLISKIDVDTGFCNDRGLAEADHGSYLGPTGGYNQVQTAYAPWDRLLEAGTTNAAKEQKPTLKCANSKNDLFTGPSAKSGGTEGKNGKVEGNGALTVPVGLITSDEVVFAGGFMYQNNNGYWLYTNQSYWTMSPYIFNVPSANVFYVSSSGYLSSASVYTTSTGVRPVINLKADTDIEFQDPSGAGKGTTSNPYIVK